MSKSIQSFFAVRVGSVLGRCRPMQRCIPRRRKLSLVALLAAALGCYSGPRQATKPNRAPNVTDISVQAQGEAEVAQRFEYAPGTSVDCQSRRVRFEVLIVFRIASPPLAESRTPVRSR